MLSIHRPALDVTCFIPTANRWGNI